MGYKYVAPRIEGYAFLGFLGVATVAAVNGSAVNSSALQ
jgi:hypothetical protein